MSGLSPHTIIVSKVTLLQSIINQPTRSSMYGRNKIPAVIPRTLLAVEPRLQVITIQKVGSLVARPLALVIKRKCDFGTSLYSVCWQPTFPFPSHALHSWMRTSTLSVMLLRGQIMVGCAAGSRCVTRLNIRNVVSAVTLSQPSSSLEKHTCFVPHVTGKVFVPSADHTHDTSTKYH